MCHEDKHGSDELATTTAAETVVCEGFATGAQKLECLLSKGLLVRDIDILREGM